MQTLNFKTPAGEEELKKALAFCAKGIAGVEMYTFLRLEGKNIPEGRFFCAGNEKGETVSAVFNTGDVTVTKEPDTPPYKGLLVMEYTGALPQDDPAIMSAMLPETLAFYKAQGEGVISPADETRYVYRARALRDALALGFCVKENGNPVSFAYITAQNEDTALLGDVFTVPSARGKGYARRCVKACVRAALQSGKVPYVLCEAHMEGFYRGLGFRTVIVNDEQL